VQAIDYSNRNEDGSVGSIPDSLVKPFKTRLGRTVYDGGGVTPDVKIDPENYSRVSLSLIYSDIIRDYSVQFFKTRESIPSPDKFSITDAEFEEFVKYASQREFDHRTASEVEYDKLLSIAKREGLIDEFSEEVKRLESKIKLDKRGAIMKNASEIRHLLEEEIASRYYYQRGRIQSIVKNDEQLSEGCKSGAY